MSNRLPEFAFHSVELHRDPLAYHHELYAAVQRSPHGNRKLGTRIWWAANRRNETRCIKEFFRANADEYQREIPDPVWRSTPPPLSPMGSERGLPGQRAQLYDERANVPLDTGALRAIGRDISFQEHFNAYSFELEALLLQCARHYGHHQIVQSYRWGPMILDEAQGPRFAIEMERLSPLPPPGVGDYLSIVHRLLEMMSAVTQLHAMTIPVRCYPPELVRDLQQARQTPITRSFHFDLSPDQFLLREGDSMMPPEVVLIDFNSSRMAHAEYTNFFWYAIPGKDYYQPAERRNLQDFRHQNRTFQSSPVYDLYALLAMGLFYLMRQREDQTRPSQIKEWSPTAQYQQWLTSPHFVSTLQNSIARNRGIDPSPLLELFAATLPHPPHERRNALLSVSQLNWLGLHDWMLVPKAMNAIARNSMGRQFQVAWNSPTLELDESAEAIPLHTLLTPHRCQWQPGVSEQGRIDHPSLSLEHIYFIQGGDPYPVVRNGMIDPTQAGQYEIFAVWRGCVDFGNPLYVNVRPSTAAVVHSVPSHQEGLTEHHVASIPSVSPEDEASSYAPSTPIPDDRTIVEQPIPVFSADASQPSEQFDSIEPLDREEYHTLRPYVQVEDLPHDVEEETANVFWSMQPSPLLSPSLHNPQYQDSFTADFDRESQDVSYETPLAPQTPSPAWEPSSLRGEAYDTAQDDPAQETSDGLPSGALVAEQIEMAAIFAPEEPIADPQWMRQIAKSEKTHHLDAIQQKLILHYRGEIPLDYVVQLHARRCQMAVERNDYTLQDNTIPAMVQLLRNSNITKLHTGILLNNLTVYCYMQAWQSQRLPHWESSVGLDPLSHLKHWLQLSEPPSASANPTPMLRLRKRSRETVACALHIKQTLFPS